MYVFSPVQNMNLKIIYGLKMSKTADLDINFFLHLHVLCLWLVATHTYPPK